MKMTDSETGEGKIMYTFSANANILSANFPFSVLPAGGEGVGFSTLAECYGECIRCFTPPLARHTSHLQINYDRKKFH